MSRTIKFRAWTLDKKMEYFDLEDLYGGELDDGTHIIDSGVPIMQFTGLLDRHGKEIYEGDVVARKAGNGPRTTNAVVIYDAPSFRFDRPVNKVNEFKKHGSLVTVKCGEVIGNRYEQPELVT